MSAAGIGRRGRWGIGLGLCLLAVVGVWGGLRVVAFFSAQAQSPAQQLTTGLLSIEVTSSPSNSLANLMPGDERTLAWTVSNTGSAPVFIKARLEGEWQSSADGDELNLVVDRVEFQAEDEWIPLVQQALPLGREFLLSRAGDDQTLVALAPGTSFEVRTVVTLPLSTGDQYQNRQLAIVLHAAARQVTSGAAWPIEY